MYHLITTSQSCHNGASMVINGAYLPPQELPFSFCHHSRPSLPQNLMVLELPFMLLSLLLCVSSPFRSLNQRTDLLVGRQGWPLHPFAGDSFSFVLGLCPPCQGKSDPERVTGRESHWGSHCLPIHITDKWPKWTSDAPSSHTHWRDNVHAKWQLPLGEECMWIWEVQSSTPSKLTTWEYLIAKRYFSLFHQLLQQWGRLQSEPITAM